MIKVTYCSDFLQFGHMIIEQCYYRHIGYKLGQVSFYSWNNKEEVAGLDTNTVAFWKITPKTSKP